MNAGPSLRMKLLPGLELFAAGTPVEAPVAQGADDRHRLDPRFGQAEASALPPDYGPSAGEDPCVDEPLQAVGEDIRGDALD